MHEVHELVRDHVVDDGGRRLHDAPVQPQHAARVAAAPALDLVPQQQQRRVPRADLLSSSLTEARASKAADRTLGPPSRRSLLAVTG